VSGVPKKVEREGPKSVEVLLILWAICRLVEDPHITEGLTLTGGSLPPP
jgi:hypothetical protein